MSNLKKSSIIKQNFMAEKTSFEKFEEKLKNSIFGVLFVLLKNNEGNFYVEMFSLLTELFQFMYYPFSQNVSQAKNIYKYIYIYIYS